MKDLIDFEANVKFTDIFEMQGIQRMQDMFSDATGVASIITLPNGTPITEPSNFTRLCNDIIRKTPIGCANCIKSDAKIGGQNSCQLVVQECLSAGLWDAGVPISVGGLHIANWLIGQVQTEGVDIEKMLCYADEIGADRKDFLAALDEVPKMTEKRFQKVAEMLLLFANEMSEKAYSNLRLKKEIEEHEIANQNLQKSEESLYITLHSIGDGVITTDRDGYISSMNPVAEQLCGWKLTDAKGKQLTEVFYIINAETRISVDNPVDKVLECGQIVGLANHTVLISKDKTEYQIADSAAPIKNNEGEIIGVVLVFSDVTEKYNLEESQKQSDLRYRNLLNHLETGVVVHAPDTSIISCNPRATQLLGLSEMQLFGKTAMHPDWKFLAENGNDLPLEDFPVNKIIASKQSLTDYIIGIQRPINNDLVWVMVNGFQVLNARNEATEIIISFIDITERKKNDEELINSRADFIELFDKAPIGYHELDSEGRIVHINETELEILGYTKQEVLGVYGWQFVEDKLASRKRIEGKLRGELSYAVNAECIFLQKDGTPIVFLINDKIIKDNNGKITGIRSTLQDITKWKKTEIALHESEKKHRILFLESPDAYLILEDGVFVDCNKETERLLRGSRALIIGQTPYSMSPEFQPNNIKSKISAVQHIEYALKKGKNTFEWIHTRFDGSELYVEVTLSAMVLQGKQTFFTTWRDITKRKQAEEMLLNERLVLRTLIDNMPDAIYIKDMDGRKTLSNIADVKNMGATTEKEVLGKTDFEMLTSEIAQGFFEDDQMVLNSEIPVLNREEYLINDKGEKVWLLTSKLPLFNKNHKIIGLVGIGRDITIRRKAEHALRKSESFLKETQMIAKLGTYTLNLINNTWSSSELLDSLFGISANYYKSIQGWINIIHPDWQKEMNNYLENEVIAKKMKFDKVYKIIKQNNNDERWVHGIGELVFDENMEPVSLIGTIQDITELKQTELELEKQLRLQQILMDISSEYINLPLEKIEDTIHLSLHNLAEFIEADRAYIFDYNTENQLSSNTYEWCGDGIESKIENKKAIPLNKMVNFQAHSQGQVVAIPKVSDLPEGDFKQWLQARELKSIITIPMMINGISVGFVGFDSVKHHHFYTKNEEGLLMTFAQMLVNIHLRRAVEETLQNERLLLRTVIDNIPDTIYAKDLNFRKTLANKAEVELLGAKSEEEVIGKTDAIFYNEDFSTRFMENDKEVIESEIPDFNREGFIINSNNEKHWFLSSKLPLRNKDNQIIGLIGIGHDITNRKLAEEALRKSEEKYRTIFENVQDVFFQLNLEGVVLEISPSIEKLYGYKREEIIGQAISDLYFGNVDNSLDVALFNNRQGVKDFELIIKDKQGDTKVILLNAQIICDTDENPDHIDGSIRDITMRKNAEVALIESQRKFKNILENSPFHIWAFDGEVYNYINKAFFEFSGLEKQEMMTVDKWIKCLHPDDIQSAGRVWNEAWEKKDEHDNYFRLLRKDGVYRDFWCHVVPIFDEYNEFKHFQGFNFDITERKQADEALNKSQNELKKFAAHLQNVREEERIILAREIHDELGQILIAIKIDTGLLKQKTLKLIESSNFTEMSTKFEALTGLVDNTIKTTRKIMTDLRPEVLYLLGFVEAAKLHTTKFQERHNIICNFNSEIPKLSLNVQQSVALYRIVQEALTNIVKHAKATEVNINVTQKESILTMEISDNGIGIDQNQKTRTDSYGMIGMKERVFLLEGHLTITGKIGKGTTIKLQMPYVNPIE